MKTKTVEELPVLTLPRLSLKLESIADNLARSALEFGVAINEHFPMRLATIGFANGVMLGLRGPEAAASLEELLAGESVPPAGELVGFTAALIAAFPGERDWTDEINRFLRQQWERSADGASSPEPRQELLLRILHGIRCGLVIARESPETAQKIQEHIKTLWLENQFLSGRLFIWSRSEWKPIFPPFVEFTADYYQPATIERRVIHQAAAAIYPVATTLNNPWDFSFWLETGWNGGRNFAKNHPDECRAMLSEAGADYLKTYQRLYQSYALGSIRSDGEVQIAQATRRFIGELADPGLARCYCTGREPRRLARVVFDFTFWMGIFASFPVPIIEERETRP